MFEGVMSQRADGTHAFYFSNLTVDIRKAMKLVVVMLIIICLCKTKKKHDASGTFTKKNLTHTFTEMG